MKRRMKMTCASDVSVRREGRGDPAGPAGGNGLWCVGAGAAELRAVRGHGALTLSPVLQRRPQGAGRHHQHQRAVGGLRQRRQRPHPQGGRPPHGRAQGQRGRHAHGGPRGDRPVAGGGGSGACSSQTLRPTRGRGRTPRAVGRPAAGSAGTRAADASWVFAGRTDAREGPASRPCALPLAVGPFLPRASTPSPLYLLSVLVPGRPSCAAWTGGRPGSRAAPGVCAVLRVGTQRRERPGPRAGGRGSRSKRASREPGTRRVTDAAIKVLLRALPSACVSSFPPGRGRSEGAPPEAAPSTRGGPESSRDSQVPAGLAAA